MYTASFALAETAAALRSGEMDLLDYVDAACDLVEAVEPHVHSLLAEADRRTSAPGRTGVARTLPDPAGRPALFGVLVGVKGHLPR
ncbi:MAG: hypothetical protein R2873_02190 [Caldilineaceae bacterium]